MTPIRDAAQSQQTSHIPDLDEALPRWRSEVALWQLLAQAELASPGRQPLIDLEVPACLRAPEVYAALVDVEHTEAGRGMQPEPTYPPRPAPRVDDWHHDPVIEPILHRYPVLRQLLDREDVHGVYRWARVPADEADAYSLHAVGLTDRAVGELMDPPRNELTVRALIGRAEERILDALARWERVRREVMAEAI